MTATAAQVIARARQELGVAESPPGSNTQKYGAWYGMQSVAWCAIFQSYVFAHTPGAVNLIPKFSYCPTGEQWFRDAGRWHGTPRAGDLAFFHHGGVAAHVALVQQAFPDGSFQTVEGNSNDGGSYTGGKVVSLHRPAGSAAGFGRPAYAPAGPPRWPASWLLLGLYLGRQQKGRSRNGVSGNPASDLIRAVQHALHVPVTGWYNDATVTAATKRFGSPNIGPVRYRKLAGK